MASRAQPITNSQSGTGVPRGRVDRRERDAALA
jgi:hypothetical protein